MKTIDIVLGIVLGVLFVVFWAILFMAFLTPVAKTPELLFTIDGCSTYAYYDKGNRHRYTTCENSHEIITN